MKSETIRLQIDYQKAGIEKQEYEPTLVTYVQADQNDKKPRPAVLICPGGGYTVTSSREAECIAVQYVAAGCQAFILYYSCAPDVFPTALLELAYSVSYLREHAQEWNLAADQIIVCGFSAGGHLAASLGCFWNQPFVYEPLGKTAEEIQPNGNLLCYPVITAGEYAHRGSFDWLCRGLNPQVYPEFVSLELRAGAQNPPTFIWHTYEDQSVPVENSLLYAAALRRGGISLEMHIYPEGPHGLSLANHETDNADGGGYLPQVQSWMQLSKDWIRYQFRGKKSE